MRLTVQFYACLLRRARFQWNLLLIPLKSGSFFWADKHRITVLATCCTSSKEVHRRLIGYLKYKKSRLKWGGENYFNITNTWQIPEFSKIVGWFPEVIFILHFFESANRPQTLLTILWLQIIIVVYLSNALSQLYASPVSSNSWKMKRSALSCTLSGFVEMMEQILRVLSNTPCTWEFLKY